MCLVGKRLVRLLIIYIYKDLLKKTAGFLLLFVSYPGREGERERERDRKREERERERAEDVVAVVAVVGQKHETGSWKNNCFLEYFYYYYFVFVFFFLLFIYLFSFGAFTGGKRRKRWRKDGEGGRRAREDGWVDETNKEYNQQSNSTRHLSSEMLTSVSVRVAKRSHSKTKYKTENKTKQKKQIIIKIIPN